MKNMSLNAKIYVIMAVLIAGSLSVGTLGLVKMKSINDSISEIINGPAKRIEMAYEINTSLLYLMISEKNLINESDFEKMKEHQKQMEKTELKLNNQFKDVYSVASPEGKVILDKFKNQLESWKNTSQKVISLSLSGKNAEAGLLSMGEGREKMNLADQSLRGLINLNLEFMKKTELQTDESFQSAIWFVILFSLVAIMIGVILATIILKSLSSSINKIIAGLTDNSHQVTCAARQIASSSVDLSQSATEQAASLEETAASIEEMNSMMQKNSENASRTNELASSSSLSAEKGQEVVKEMISAIDNISSSNNRIMEQIEASNQQISDIVKVIAEIGNKTKVINDIVFQTKLLSFNASVEAARAGEHGKGFAVVAEEVGNLAQMSGNAAKEITSMLDSSIQKVEGIVNETKQKVGLLVQDGKSRVELGSKIARQCGEVLVEIVENVSEVTRMSNEISSACIEQSQGVQEITKAMGQLDQVTQTNAATSEECASAAEQLSSQSESLRNVVDDLVRAIKGEKGADIGALSQSRDIPKKQLQSIDRLSNVVQMKKTESKTKASFSGEYKKASGYSASNVPSENNPHFEDI